MNVFLLLLLSHLIADFPFQTNFVFKARYKYKYGGIFHILIHTVLNIFFLTPYILYYQTWIGIGIISITHYFIDRMKKSNIVTFLLDQVLHIAIIIVVAFIMRDLKPQYILGDINKLFFNHKLLIILIGFLFTTFFNTILLHFIKITWYSDYEGTQLEGYEKYSGFLDRGLVYFIVLLSLLYEKYYFLPLSLVPPVARIAIWNMMRGKYKDYKNVYLQDIILGFVKSVVFSIIIYLILIHYF